MAIDISADFAFFDNTETVTYRSRNINTTSSFTDYSGVLALRRGVQGSPVGVGDGGLMIGQTATWHIKTSSLSVTPKKGDRIVSSSGTWEVISDSFLAFNSRHQCETRKIV